MFDQRLTRLAGTLLFLLAAAACGESTKTDHKDPIIVPPDPVPTVVSFEVAPTEIQVGATATLQWITRDVSSIRIADGDGAEVPLGDAEVARGAVEVQPTRTTTYTLVAFGPGGEAEPGAWGSATVTVTPVPPDPPTIEEFTASAASVPVGGEVVLSWRTAGATEISLEDDAGEEIELGSAGPASGQVTVHPTRSPTVYYLVAVGAGRASASVGVEVTGSPRIARFFVDPIVPVHVGDPVTLTWETINASRVVIRRDGAVVVDATDEPSGSRAYELTDSATFAIEATGLGEAATAEVLARVGPKVLAFASDQRVVRAGDPVELTWAVADADRAEIDGPGDYHHAIGAAELASGHATVTVLAGGPYVLRAFRGEVPATATVSVEVTEAPRVRSFWADPAQVTAASDHPATVTLHWNQDGAGSCMLLANNAVVPGYQSFACAAVGSATAQVRGDTTFRLVAQNPAGQHDATASVDAIPPARIDAFAFVPGRRIAQGEAITLSWKATDAVAISMTKNDLPFAVDPTAFTGSAPDLVDADAVYVLTAVNSLGFPTSAEVSVAVGVPELLSFAADPDFVAIGSAFDLRWTANGGDRLVVADEGGQELLEVTDPGTIDHGSTTVLAPVTPGTYTYTVTATNGDGPSSASVDVTVSDGPMIESFTAAPVEISLGETVTFTWSVRNDAHGNPPTLALSDNYGHTYPEISGANQNNGTLTVTPAEEGRHVFTLTASTPGTTPHSVTVVVEVTVPPFLHAFTATPDMVSTQGGTVVPQVTLSWQSENAVEVTLWESDAAGNVTPPPFHRISLANQDPQAVLDAGSFLVEPTATTWYVARARNRVGSQVQAILKVTVDPPEIGSFAVAPTDVPEAGVTTLSWDTTNATSVSIVPRPVTRLGATYVDVSTLPGATQTTLPDGNEVVTINFPAGFTFPFEGVDRAAIQVSTEGWAGFNLTNTATNASGYAFPTSSTYSEVNFGLFWCSLDQTYNSSPAGELWSGSGTDALGDFFAIQWKHWSWYSSSYRPSDLNFELILRPSGDFEYRYGEMTANAAGREAGLGCDIGYQGTTDTRPWGQLVPHQQAAAGGLAGTGFAVAVSLPVDGTHDTVPPGTTTYTLTATSADGDATAETTVTVWKTPTISFFRPNPPGPVATVPFEMEWAVQDATLVRVLDDTGAVVCTVTDPLEIAAGSCQTVRATQGPTSYTLEAENGPPGTVVSTASRTTNLSVFAYLAVTSFAIAPSEFVEAGDTVTLSWTTAGAVEILIQACVPRSATCTDITPSPVNPVAGSMTHTVASSTEFRIHAYDVMYLEAYASVSAWVGAGSLDTLTASTTQVLPGGSTTLTWTSTDLDSMGLTPFPLDVSGSAPYLDVSTTGGISVPMAGSNDSGRYTINFPAGFTFPWYGTPRTGLIATTDGWLTFDMSYGSADYTNAELPDSTNTALQIAPFWDDGEAVSPAAVYWKLEQTASGVQYLVVQWKELELYSDSSSSLNFEVVLWQTGEFDFRYGPMIGTGSYEDDARGAGATIGFQSPDLAVFHNLSHNTEFPGGLTGRAWRFTPALPVNGSFTVSPGASTTYRLCGTNESLYEACREIRIVVVQPGDLLFSEAMIAPADAGAEWFELRNTSPDPLDLAGWTVASGPELYTIPAAPPLVVPPGGHAVFARSDAAGNGGFTPDAVYGAGTITLDDAADSLALFFGGVPVDQVSWDATWVVPANQSIAVNPALLARNPAVNDPATAWCPTVATYGTGTYGGSPGADGPGCAAPPTP